MENKGDTINLNLLNPGIWQSFSTYISPRQTSWKPWPWFGKVEGGGEKVEVVGKWWLWGWVGWGLSFSEFEKTVVTGRIIQCIYIYVNIYAKLVKKLKTIWKPFLFIFQFYICMQGASKDSLHDVFPAQWCLVVYFQNIVIIGWL